MTSDQAIVFFIGIVLIVLSSVEMWSPQLRGVLS